MTDRELLERAARAAGYEFNGLVYEEQTGLLVWSPPTNYESQHWNPLTDDADAFRLAVQLRLSVHPVYEWEGPWNPHGTLKDPYAATRRAIVRAAADLAQ